ncbi:cytochrome b/b6 domain-containing protein [Sulfurirhabdus autotrophica]|uniref:Cytochrome b n=1 Tax=Sulfurirhabdus autotrophica TaxID=1706046 RepID=A0A4R3YE36_9PROT|nr:cytochrome b/b6 domain-containing protein [Sulfurirhabdus autotrophica]TCV90310.1 cytochrome b [Sulfurirhabdus autotrophica]
METITYERRKTYDGVLRLIHAWNGIAILFMIITVLLSEFFGNGPGEKTLWLIHIYGGYALVTGLVARLVWGIVGPKHARFSDMWYPSHWWNAVRSFSLRSPSGFGHNTLASAAYLAVYAILFMMAATGLSLAAIEHSVGPLSPWLADSAWLKDLFKEPHEFGYNVIIAFIVVHIAALIWHEWKDKTPTAQSMVSGYQYRVSESEEKNHE